MCDVITTAPLTAVTDELVCSISAAIWKVAAGLDANESADTNRWLLIDSVKVHLARAHPELIARKASAKKCSAGQGKRKRSGAREWRPSRPRLALGAARLLKAETGLEEAPAGKLVSARLPFKVFSNAIAHQLHTTDSASGFSHKSVLCAVTEVVAEVFAEAQASAAAEDSAATFELHGSVDAAWKATAARGGGIAMDAEGRELVVAAAGRVAARLEALCGAL
jgi:hypothetical protein